MVQIKPLIYFSQDLVAHAFYKMEHLATIHYENGAYHLHNELKKTNDDSDNSSTKSEKSQMKKNTEKFPEQLTSNTQFEFNALSKNCIITNNDVPLVLSGYYTITSPPPQHNL